MRNLVAIALIVLSGCVLIPVERRGSSKSAVTSEEKCPPGHRWSDGKCHDTGKGHDPDKKKGGKGKP